MYLTHLSIGNLFCIYCTDTYLCRAIARALMFFAIFYIHDSKYNVMLCYFILHDVEIKKSAISQCK